MELRVREIGNSIELITSEEIVAAGVTNVDEILRGRIQGLTMTGSTGTPGVGANINIRGLTSINGRTSPLIYVDGIRVGSENGACEDAGTDGGAVTVLGSISPEDIERIEVIKAVAPAAGALDEIRGQQQQMRVVEIEVPGEQLCDLRRLVMVAVVGKRIVPGRDEQ